MKIYFTLNGNKVTLEAPPLKTLIDIIREDLKLTGTKEDCRSGECGACLVLMDDEPVNACLIPAFRLNNRKIITVEGLSKEKLFLSLRKILSEKGFCGFCSSGVAVSLYSLFTAEFNPIEEDIKLALSGHQCRCSSTNSFLRAVKNIADMRKER